MSSAAVLDRERVTGRPATTRTDGPEWAMARTVERLCAEHLAAVDA